MRGSARVVLAAAVVSAIAMEALETGGWWWAWLAGIAVLILGGGVRLPLLGGVRLDRASRHIIRENRRVRRDNRQLARQRRRVLKRQRQAARRQQ